MWTRRPHPPAFTSVPSERFPAFNVPATSALRNAGHPFLLRPCSLASRALHHLSPLTPRAVTSCAWSPGGSLSWCPRPLVPKRRGIFFNTALIRIFLHSKPAMVPRGTRGPVTGGACLSSPTAPHHTASRGTCRSRSRWPRAPEPSSVLPFLSLLVGPPLTLPPHPSPPAAPTCSSGPKLRPQGAGCDSVAHIDLALFRMSA